MKIQYYLYKNQSIIFKVIIGNNNTLDENNGITWTRTDHIKWVPVYGWNLESVKISSIRLTEKQAFIELL